VAIVQRSAREGPPHPPAPLRTSRHYRQRSRAYCALFERRSVDDNLPATTFPAATRIIRDRNRTRPRRSSHGRVQPNRPSYCCACRPAAKRILRRLLSERGGVAKTVVEGSRASRDFRCNWKQKYRGRCHPKEIALAYCLLRNLPSGVLKGKINASDLRFAFNTLQEDGFLSLVLSRSAGEAKRGNRP
jgi:hypothetical protein